jgi:hypothetical protein
LYVVLNSPTFLYCDFCIFAGNHLFFRFIARVRSNIVFVVFV